MTLMLCAFFLTSKTTRRLRWPAVVVSMLLLAFASTIGAKAGVAVEEYNIATFQYLQNISWQEARDKVSHFGHIGSMIAFYTMALSCAVNWFFFFFPGKDN